MDAASWDRGRNRPLVRWFRRGRQCCARDARGTRSSVTTTWETQSDVSGDKIVEPGSRSTDRLRQIGSWHGAGPFIQRIDMTDKTRKLLLVLSFIALSFGAGLCSAQVLSPKWEELTSPDFGKAIQKAAGACVLPMGSIEKFGPLRADPQGQCGSSPQR